MLYKKNHPIHIAFIGCGNITKKHAKWIKNIDKNVSLSFASRSKEKANKFVKQCNGVHSFGTYDDAINNSAINTIMVNTPPTLHFEWVEKALLNGKHVIVEKPPFLRSSDFDILAKIALQKNLQLLVAENYYYRPLRKQIKKYLNDGTIGRPLFLYINATKKQKSKGDWRDDVHLTNKGALYEGGIHWINFINNIGLDITNIIGLQPIRNQQLERSMQVIAKTTEGPIINLLYSWETNTLFKGLRLSKIMGTEGSINFESNGVLTIVRGKKFRIFFPKFSKLTGAIPMWKNFLTSLQSGTKPSFTWEMAKSDLELVEKAYDN